MLGIISTHTPHTGCDFSTDVKTPVPLNFNSHTPYGVRPSKFLQQRPPIYFNSHTPYGVRRRNMTLILFSAIFQLTHPIRGATLALKHAGKKAEHFNSHTPYGVRHCAAETRSTPNAISTHTPHTGCDRNR